LFWGLSIIILSEEKDNQKGEFMQEMMGGQNPEEQQSSAEAPAQVSGDERTMAILAHLLGIFFSFVAPLVIWLIKKDESEFVDYHGKEALNFQLTMLIVYVVGAILPTIRIEQCITLAVGVVIIIFSIMAAVAANKGEYYRYPISIRFIK